MRICRRLAQDIVLTSKDSKELADSINNWYTPKLIAQIQNEERLRYSTQSIHRHTYAPMLNAKSGIIRNTTIFS